MAYFKDLSLYSYSKGETSILPAFNIGWLSKDQSFIAGETSQQFREKLYGFCVDENLVLVMRGFHKCEFCELSYDEWLKTHPDYGKSAKFMGLGTGEIRVIGKSVIYAAPSLIYHYISTHDYMPPQEFIEAILTGPQPGSTEHNALLNNYKHH